MQQYENTPQQMAYKLMEFIRDFSDNEEDMKMETEYVTELFDELGKSDKYNVLIHHLDTMFMSDIFNKE